MKTLQIANLSDGRVLGTIVLGDDGKVNSKGLGVDLIDSLVRSLGITPAEAFDMRTDWSNGYVTAQLI